MFWIKAFHIIFVISWFAGLFYLPRILVNLAMVEPSSKAERDRLLLMARKLLRFMHMLAPLAVVFGLWLWLHYGIGSGTGMGWLGMGWLDVKLFIVVLLLAYHYACARLLRQFEAQQNTRSHVWFRWFNEIPVVLLVLTVLLVVFKPF